ncbi:hypothetical protein [Nitrobacter sp.]|uniref:hypothetical protein n=1 Tax=Nitrobacter sp. TaxID=29420 RepID=UPI0025FA250B|nr:hypothetical protein [Nitrobacter sp.]
MNESLHPLTPHHLPPFITAPGDIDILMVVMGIVLQGGLTANGGFLVHRSLSKERR